MAVLSDKSAQASEAPGASLCEGWIPAFVGRILSRRKKIDWSIARKLIEVSNAR